MTILYVFRSLAIWGGIERVLVDKMNYLATIYGYDVYMITSDQGNHLIPYRLEKKVHFKDLGIRFHQQYQYKGFKRFKRFWVLKHLRALFEQRLAVQLGDIKPDVIVCTTADYINVLVKLKGSIPLVVESHSICLRTIEYGKCWLFRKMYRFNYLRSLSKVDVLVSLTEGDAAEWRKVFHRVEVIPNIVHINDADKKAPNSKHVIFVGRLDYQKRPMEIIRIWQRVYPKYPDWWLDIYGEGEQLNELQQVACSLNMNIVIHPPTEHIFSCYCKCAFLVSSSLFEPFGLVLPEAMSCGLPVIAYDCPYGPSDIITNGHDGFLIEFDDIGAYVDKISHLMNSSDLRSQMGGNAINSSKRYAAQNVMPRWKELFERLSAKN